jgi:hypothetical protein
VEYLRTHFFHEGRLKEPQALYILEQASNIFSREPNMVPLKSPVTSPLFFLSSLIYRRANDLQFVEISMVNM